MDNPTLFEVPAVAVETTIKRQIMAVANGLRVNPATLAEDDFLGLWLIVSTQLSTPNGQKLNYCHERFLDYDGTTFESNWDRIDRALIVRQSL
mgnify:CR=1 FL=1